MEFRQFETFVAVAETGSFTAAGERLHLSQPAVSQMIRKLEDSVGEALFLRSTRRLELTARARTLLPVAHEMLALRRSILDEAQGEPKLTRGLLRVGTSSSATAFLWARMYRAFADEYPLIELDIRTTSHTDRTREDLLWGRLDIGFLPFPHGEPRLDAVMLGNHTAELVCAADHPILSRPGPITVEDIAVQPFLLYEVGINFRRLSDYFFRRLGILPRVSAQSNDTYLIKTLAELGFGLAFVPNWAIEDELATGRLHKLPFDTGNMTEELGLAFLKSQVSRPAQRFVRFCLDNLDLIPAVARQTLPRGWKHHSQQ